ncbi:hypothetical protein RRG08_034091 [Elysia crispata]|uniref:Uncharacterized protein n=1 Tax=Elysia crispata TaxID=231223 RepID=A0AAE1D3V0_9GAST|nr:hypothetical protein RRG08_034091 [Elysia crispata]
MLRNLLLVDAALISPSGVSCPDRFTKAPEVRFTVTARTQSVFFSPNCPTPVVRDWFIAFRGFGQNGTQESFGATTNTTIKCDMKQSLCPVDSYHWNSDIDPTKASQRALDLGAKPDWNGARLRRRLGRPSLEAASWKDGAIIYPSKSLVPRGNQSRLSA